MGKEAQRTPAGAGRHGYYVEGNTVRRMQAVPKERPERETREQPQRRQPDRQQEQEQNRRRRIARRNQERALRMSRSYVVFLTMAVAVFGAFAGISIQLQSDVTARIKNISRLESQIADLTADNDEAYKRISMTVDLDSIRNYAMQVLGMSYAKESQIVYYSVGNDDYMNQYGEIPARER